MQPISKGEIGKRIRGKRKDAGLTLEALSAKTYISVQMLSNYELGKVDLSTEVLGLLAVALMVSPEYLLTGIEPIYSKEDADLLKVYEQLSERDRSILLVQAKAFLI